MDDGDRLRRSRRQFLGSAATVAAAAPFITPASALGQDGGTAAGDRITVAGIGIRGQGWGITRAVMGNPGTQIVALCDVDANVLANRKKEVDQHYGNTDCRTYSDFREVMAREDIDAVVIGTPDHWHALITIAAARAGKDIYCEKPLTHSLAEGRAVVEAVRRHGVVLQVGSMQRASGNMKRACELVRNGCIGTVQHINVGLPDMGEGPVVDDYPEPPPELDYDFWVGPAQWAPYHPRRCHGSWRWWMGFGGGQLMDWIGHHGDIAHMGMGYDHTGPSRIEPDLWQVSKRSNLYDAPVNYRVQYEYRNGPTMTVGNMRSMPEIYRQHGDTGTQWLGEDGAWVWVARSGIKASSEDLLKASPGGTAFRFPRGQNHVSEWLACVRSRQQPLAPVEAGHRSASIGHLGKIASYLGRELEWNPATETFRGDDMATRMLGRPCRGEWSL